MFRFCSVESATEYMFSGSFGCLPGCIALGGKPKGRQSLLEGGWLRVHVNKHQTARNRESMNQRHIICGLLHYFKFVDCYIIILLALQWEHHREPCMQQCLVSQISKAGKCYTL